MSDSEVCDLCRKDGADCRIAGRPAHKGCVAGRSRGHEISSLFLPVGVSWCGRCRTRLTLGYECLWCKPKPAAVDWPRCEKCNFAHKPDPNVDCFKQAQEGIRAAIEGQDGLRPEPPTRGRWRPSRWEGGRLIEEGQRVQNDKIDAFVAEIDQVCKKHGFNIGHEDGHGAFEIVDYEAGTWLDAAHDCTSDRPTPTPPPGDENLPSVYKAARLDSKFWTIDGPGLGSMPLFEKEHSAQAVADALNRAYQLGHTFGRTA